MQKSININLNYHDFSGTPYLNFARSLYTIDFFNFIKHLDELKNKKNISLSSLIDPGWKEFSYSLTFDDGKKSNLYIAEELAQRNLTGTFFIIKNKCQYNNRYLNKADIKKISALGMEIGSHSCSHRHLNRLSKREMINELHESKIFLEDLIAKPVYSIAYPGGHCGTREFDAAFNEGYKINRTCIIGTNELPLKEKYIRNINIKSNIDIDTFIKIINLDPYCFLKMKFRERLLSFPKFIHSKFISGNF